MCLERSQTLEITPKLKLDPPPPKSTFVRLLAMVCSCFQPWVIGIILHPKPVHQESELLRLLPLEQQCLCNGG